MISTTYKRNFFGVSFTFLFLAAFGLQGCGQQTVLQGNYKTRVSSPSKRTPSSSAIPPTQRPYRIDGKTYYPLPSSHGFVQKGIASWYGTKFHGRKTSNGEVYNMYAQTAAHKTLPMNTKLLVENLENGKEMVVRINDRGPFVKGRIIDLSFACAQELGISQKGTARVRITALGEAVTYAEGKKPIERFLPHDDFNAGDFYVQIGSFTNANNATNLKNKMIEWGKKAVIETFDDGDIRYYRVQVQAGNSLTYADRMERAMSASGFPGAFVVAR